MAADRVVASRPLGILGGTFDPIHLGHIALARQALIELDIEQILVVPNADPPHKQDQPVTPAVEREAMVALAIANEPELVLSRLELEREGPSYAVDTVAEVAGRSVGEGRPEPWFILSSEAFEAFDMWRDPERILESCRLAVAPRAGADPAEAARMVASFPGFEDRFSFLDGPMLDVASTEIRQKVARGELIDDLVPDAVADHIREYRLYETAGSGAGGSVPADPRTSSRPGLPATRAESGIVATGVEPPTAVDAEVLALAHRVVEAASDKKASDIVLLDVRSQTTMTDYFVLCTGASDRQLGAIVDGIIEDAKAAGLPPISREGDASSHWLLVDFGGVIVHVMSAPERGFYQLEKLWSEASLLLHIL